MTFVKGHKGYWLGKSNKQHGVGLWMKGKKHSVTTLAKMSEAKKEEKNFQWKGSNVGYGALHDWVRRHKGKPKECGNSLCSFESKTYHWANVSREYKREKSDWVSLCVKCHKAYDMGRIQLT